MTFPLSPGYAEQVSAATESRPVIRVRGRSFMALVLAPEPPAANGLPRWTRKSSGRPRFFDGRPVIVDLAGLPREQPNVAGLIDALRERGIRVIGTEGAHPSWEGLEKWGAPLSGSRAGASRSTVPRRAGRPGSRPGGGTREPPARLVVEHPVRSGQSVVFENGRCHGRRLGRVGRRGHGGRLDPRLRHAARPGGGRSPGNPRARIFCRRLEAELLAIDGLYRTADDVEPALRGRAVQAWLDGQTMQITALD